MNTPQCYVTRNLPVLLRNCGSQCPLSQCVYVCAFNYLSTYDSRNTDFFLQYFQRKYTNVFQFIDLSRTINSESRCEKNAACINM
jgi:hypothetical protein